MATPRDPTRASNQRPTAPFLKFPSLQALFFARTDPSRIYRKRGEYLDRPAGVGETVLTIVADRLETLKTAGFGHVVLMNLAVGQSAERYIVSPDMFARRYERRDETLFVDGFAWRKARARGLVQGFLYEGESVRIMAPWGEAMIVEPGDFIARPVDGAETDIYRIERRTFEATYALEP